MKNNSTNKNVRNLLTTSQMVNLNNLGLVDMGERLKCEHIEFSIQELLQILPGCIVKDETMYTMYVYKTAFDVIAIQYKNPNFVSDCIYRKGCLEAKHNEDVGNFVDLLYDCLLWVNENYPEYLEDYKNSIKNNN